VTDPIGTIRDEKLVATTGDGLRMVWRLEVCDEDNNDLWTPYVVDEDGDVVTAPNWMPLPGSQHLFLSCPVFEVLYEGTRGPGKTLSLLMDFAREVGKGYGKAWRGILFRRTFGDLDDVVRKIEAFFPTFFPGFRFLKSKSEYQAVWPDGEALLLRPLEKEEDYEEYHGHEYPWIGFEELTQWETSGPYLLMFSCCRPTGPGIPCRVRATTNPYGVGHGWVKKRFQLPQMRGRVIKLPGEVPRVAIHGNLSENFLLLHSAPNYAAQVVQAAKNPAQAAAWIKGDWSVNAGGMVDDVWDPTIHIVPNFPASKIPRGWTITRAYDHGQSHPFAVGWWLESNGEPIELPGGRLVGNVRGDLILWKEWYGTDGDANSGLRLSARKIAQGIRDREKDDEVEGRVEPGPADTEIWSKDSRGTGRSPADDMEDLGVYFHRADKSPGSRKRGWEMLRSLLDDAKPNRDGTREREGLFVCERCKFWQEFVPSMPRDSKDPDDVPGKYEDHLCDMTRYRVNWDRPGMWAKSGAF
jgi:hypothetical protein